MDKIAEGDLLWTNLLGRFYNEFEPKVKDAFGNMEKKPPEETGELCPNCNKKIWNPDKYGFFIPGMPEDYENSGYCLGTCAIVLE